MSRILAADKRTSRDVERTALEGVEVGQQLEVEDVQLTLDIDVVCQRGVIILDMDVLLLDLDLRHERHSRAESDIVSQRGGYVETDTVSTQGDSRSEVVKDAIFYFILSMNGLCQQHHGQCTDSGNKWVISLLHTHLLIELLR